MGTLKSFSEKAARLKGIKNLYNIDVLVETGCFKGDSIEYALSNNFIKIYSCDYLKTYVQYCEEKFKDDSRVELYNCSSHEFLKKILPNLYDQESVLFWLDAHFADNVVIKDVSLYRDIDLPLEEELRLIYESRSCKNDVILIDDFYIYRDGPYEKHSKPTTHFRKIVNDSFLNEYKYKQHLFYNDGGYMMLTK